MPNILPTCNEEISLILKFKWNGDNILLCLPPELFSVYELFILFQTKDTNKLKWLNQYYKRLISITIWLTMSNVLLLSINLPILLFIDSFNNKLVSVVDILSAYPNCKLLTLNYIHQKSQIILK